MKRIVAMTWAVRGAAALAGSGALVFALAFVVFPPIPAALKVPKGRAACGPREPERPEVAKIWTNAFGYTAPVATRRTLADSAELVATMRGLGTPLAVLRLKDGTQIVVRGGDRVLDARVSSVGAGSVTFDTSETLHIKRTASK